jgi:hypothetical protein
MSSNIALVQEENNEHPFIIIRDYHRHVQPADALAGSKNECPSYGPSARDTDIQATPLRLPV